MAIMFDEEKLEELMSKLTSTNHDLICPECGLTRSKTDEDYEWLGTICSCDNDE